jgi:peptide/nickel transport system permease protein
LLAGISEQSLGSTIDDLRRQFGLDLPPYVQYFKWLKGVISGDLGTSLVFNRPITPIILNRLRASLILAIPACLMMVLFGVSLGVLAAVKENKFIDHIITFTNLAGISIPTFVIGSIFIYIFAVQLNLIPVAFNVFSYQEFSIGKKLLFFITVLIFPSVTLSFEIVAHVARHTRASMIEEMKTNYFRTAILKGVPKKRAILYHALRNALLPTITVIAINIGYIIAGVVVVEIIYSYPGIGYLTSMAITYRDVPLILSSIIVVSGAYIFANLLADILYSFLNPRIRY